jgi:hypothetical protein
MEMELYGSSSLKVNELSKGEKDRLALFERPMVNEESNEPLEEQSEVAT